MGQRLISKVIIKVHHQIFIFNYIHIRNIEILLPNIIKNIYYHILIIIRLTNIKILLFINIQIRVFIHNLILIYKLIIKYLIKSMILIMI